MTKKEKIKLLDGLSLIYNKITLLECESRERGDEELTASLATKKTALRKVIDDLSSSLTDDWGGNAARTSKKLSAAAGGIDKNIGEIEKNIKTAENIVKASKYLDKVIITAAQIMK